METHGGAAPLLNPRQAVDVAGSPWLPEPVRQWARSWVEAIAELTAGQGPEVW
jgi:hypothetical protein